MKISKNPLTIIILLIFLAGFSVFGANDNQLASSIASLAKLLTKQFGVNEVKVAAVQGDQVYLNAGRAQYIKVGALFEIIAESRPVNDPTTKAKLGMLETHVADIKIITVRDNLCIGQVISKGSGSSSTSLSSNNPVTIAIGQKAIEKTSKLSIAVVPFSYLNSRDLITPRITQELMINELIKTGRFVVADSLRTEQIVNQLKTTSAIGSVQFTRAAGKLLGVNYIMYGCLTDMPGFMDIQCRIHDSRTGAGTVAGNVQIAPLVPNSLPK